MAEDSGPIYSSYANDEDMAELISMFVQELPQRVTAIEAASRAGDLDQLKTLAHQLKGSAGSYGFQSITDVAGQLERDLKSSSPPATIESGTKALIALLRRATDVANPELQS